MKKLLTVTMGLAVVMVLEIGSSGTIGLTGTIGTTGVGAGRYIFSGYIGDSL
jgi:hypothetical protein